MEEKYYITSVDRSPDSIYCHHDIMGEEFIRSHWHTKGQFLYTEGGIVFVNTGSKSFFLPARHYMWIAPETEHSIHPSSSQVVMRNLYFPIPKDDDPFYRRTAIYPVSDLLFQLMLFTQKWNGDLYPNDRSSYVVADAIRVLLPQLSQYELPLALPVPRDNRLKSIVSYLESHVSQDIHFNEVAGQFGFSPRTLSRLFQKDLSLSFIQYFTMLRMLKALQLLLEEKLSVNEVAGSVGYGSLPTFSNTFRKIIGVRPSEYVKMKGVL